MTPEEIKELAKSYIDSLTPIESKSNYRDDITVHDIVKALKNESEKAGNFDFLETFLLSVHDGMTM